MQQVMEVGIPVPRQLVVGEVAVYARVVVDRVVEIWEDSGGKCTPMQLYHTLHLRLFYLLFLLCI